MQRRMKDKHATFKKDVGASLGLAAFVLFSKDCSSNSDSSHRKEIINKAEKLAIEIVKCDHVPGNKAFLRVQICCKTLGLFSAGGPCECPEEEPFCC